MGQEMHMYRSKSVGKESTKSSQWVRKVQVQSVGKYRSSQWVRKVQVESVGKESTGRVSG